MILEDIISGVDNGEYFLDFLPVFAITGSTPEEINYYKKMLMTAMEGLGVKIVLVNGISLIFFIKCVQLKN